ncbi:hypothetical protein [Hymenobacter sp. APR13]|uniref:hypothetical protein n=1 Tax=Hymenobacter sp. APR13 TaxID=1356852 RepID=UPI0004E07D2D|nr:hypothetical protein [Hymenobacter sp. APR13]AII52740.1 hypothetical protein N008_12235 [Hymenobacter sp. APR13]
MAAPRLTPARLILTVLLFAYLLGVGGYLIYGFVTETGVSGWLIDWQLRYLDATRRNVTMLGNLVVFVAGIAPLFWLLMRLNQREGYVPDMSGTAPQPMQEQKMKRVMALIFLVVSGVIFWVMSSREQAGAASPVSQINLNRPGATGTGGGLARIKGELAAEHQFVLEKQRAGETVNRTRYVPLVPASWQPGQPVTFVLKTLQAAYYDSLQQKVYLFDQDARFPVAYDGTLAPDALPTYVAQDYTRQGLTLASPYYVLDDQEVIDGSFRPANPYTRWIVLGLGIVCAVAMLTSKKPAIRG